MSKTSTVHSGVTFFRSVLGVIAGAILFTSFDANAQVTLTENFATGGPHPIAQMPAGGGGGNTTLPSGWSQGKVGAGTDLDNRWDRPQGTVTGTGSTSNSAPAVNPRSYFASAVGLAYSNAAGSYALTITAAGHTRVAGEKIHVDFQSGPASLVDGTFTIASVVAGTSITITVPDAPTALRSGTCRYYFDSNLRYFSDQIATGEAAFVSSPRLDYTGWSAGTPTVSFWMYRDGGSNLGDNIQIYLNDSAIFTAASSATLLTENTTLATTIPRYYNTAPTATINTWVQYTYNLNIGAVPVGDRDNVYIVIVGTSAGGDNINIDDFAVQTWPSTQVFNSAGVFLQNNQTTAAGAVNQEIIGCKITTTNGGGPMMVTDLTFNYNGSTAPTGDIAAAKLYYSGSTPLFNPANAILVGTVVGPNATNFNFNYATSTVNVTAQMPGGVGIVLENGDNHFWLAYDIKAAAGSGNFVDAEWASFSYGFRKLNSATTTGSPTVTVPDNTGLTAGMSVAGPGIPGGTTVVSVVGTTVTISANATATSGTATLYFTTNNVAPAPYTLAGEREIDQIYCVATMSAGTSWAGYTNNDYVRAFKFDGNRVNSGIRTGQQPAAPFSIPIAGYNNPAPNQGDCDGAPFDWATNCPFVTHPPDYQMFPPDTNALTTTNISYNTAYNMTVTAGTWYSANYTAAWIDFNKAGGFSDVLFMATNVNGYGIPNGTNTPVATTITLSAGLPIGHGIVVGTRVYNSGVYVGNVSVAPLAGATTVTLGSSTLAAGAMAGPVYFINGAGEKLFQSGNMAALSQLTSTIYVPDDIATIVASNLRLRVREVYAVSTITSCGGWTWGETEDYTITLKPACNAAAFGAPPLYTRIWLGFTDDWADPNNWCGGVPTINDNAAIPDPAFLAIGNFSPVIKAGIAATAKGLWIGANQSVTVNAPGGGSITIGDSIQISAATSRLRIISGLTDSAQVNNGNLTTLNDFWRGGPSPAAATDPTYKKARAIWLFRPTEFTARGMIAGDQINKIWMNLERVNDPVGTPTAQGYQNVKVKMYYANIATFPGFPATGTAGIALPTPSSAVTTVFTGNVTDAIGLANGTKFKRTLNLATPFTWTGSTTEYVVVDMSYDNGAVNNSTGTDDNRCSPTLWARSYIIMYPSGAGNATPAENLVPTVPNTNITAHQVDNFRRPNLTFEFVRPYGGEYPINVNRNWHNNGIFDGGTYLYGNLTVITPPITKVSMVGSLDGAVLGSTQTTFHHFVINKTTGTNKVTRYTDFTVTDTLELNVGRLSLNGDPLYPNGLVTVNNPTQTAKIVSRPNPLSTAYPGGYIESENTGGASLNPYGRIRWNIGTTPGTYRFPFIQRAADGNNFFGFDYQLVSGSADLTIATYKTPATNLPTPTAQGTWVDVTNINGYYTGTNNSANMVDRYWMISNAQAGTANLVFNYASNEEPSPSVAPYSAQRWVANAGSITPGPGWEFPYQPSQANTPVTTVTLSNSSSYTNIWTLVGTSTPLPVELLDFTAVPVKDQVRIEWTTSSEINSDYFEVERSVNQSEFTFIDRVKSKGSTSLTSKYQTWDTSPLEGLQYYYLRQYDVDGRLMSYGPVPVTFGKDRFEIVTAIVSSSEEGVTVVFDYNSDEPFNYTLIDMQGKMVTAKGNNKAVKGVNVLEIPVNLSHGIYNIVLQNSQETVTRKIMY